MKKISIFIVLLSAMSFNINAQVKIGKNAKNPNPNAIFELESDTLGMLPPRIALTSISSFAPLKAHVMGMTVFNTTKTATLDTGYYYNDGTKWIQLNIKAQAKFFYMPSITVDVSTLATGQTLDLYTLYKNQFDAPAIKSTSAPADVPFFAAATDLYYYVTSYDTNAMTITSIDDNGLMTYNVSGLGATPCSLLNIVFVYK
jgi:hypothetical protein